MAIKVQCSCGRELVAKDELAGKRVRCPTCQAVLVVTARRAPGPAKVRASGPPPIAKLPVRKKPQEKGDEDSEGDEEDQLPKSRKVRERIQGLGLTKVGLLLHLIRFGFLVAIAALTLLLGAGIVMTAAGESTKGLEKAIAKEASAGILLAILYAPTPILGIAGSIFCLWVPANSGGKVPILVSLLCQAVGNLLMAVSYLTIFLAHDGDIAGAFDAARMTVSDRFALIGLGIGFAAWLGCDLAFFTFLRNMCRYIDLGEQADRATTLMMMWVLMIFVPPVLLYGIKMVLEAILDESLIPIIVFAVFMGVMLAWGRILVMVILLILAVRKVIAAKV